MRTLLLLLLLCLAAWAQGDDDFKAGNALMEQKNFREALARYQAGLRVTPDNPGLLYNAGLAAYLSGDGPTALTLWQRLKPLDPADWRLRAKLVQAYQLVGDTVSRDREVQELLALHDTSDDPEFGKQREFCRDQFEAGEEKVLVYQLFSLSGARAVRYLFLVYGSDGKRADYHLSLGSYPATTAILREKGLLGPDQRAFHLDWYGGEEHRTYSLFKTEPDYDQVREMVRKALSGELQPQSSSRMH